MCAIQWSSTSSSMWREFCWKNIVRFFITPQQKAHFGDGSSCWRLCGENSANHFHIFWSCQVLTPYSQEIHKHVNNVFSSSIPLRCDTVYMGDIQLERWSNNDKKLAHILLAASKKDGKNQTHQLLKSG